MFKVASTTLLSNLRAALNQANPAGQLPAIAAFRVGLVHDIEIDPTQLTFFRVHRDIENYEGWAISSSYDTPVGYHDQQIKGGFKYEQEAQDLAVLLAKEFGVKVKDYYDD